MNIKYFFLKTKKKEIEIQKGCDSLFQNTYISREKMSDMSDREQGSEGVRVAGGAGKGLHPRVCVCVCVSSRLPFNVKKALETECLVASKRTFCGRVCCMEQC